MSQHTVRLELVATMQPVLTCPVTHGDAHLVLNKATHYAVELGESHWAERNLLVSVISRSAAVEALGRHAKPGNYHLRLVEACSKLVRYFDSPSEAIVFE